jgi:hypothetical protein
MRSVRSPTEDRRRGPVTDRWAALAAPIVASEVEVGPDGRVYVADQNTVYVVEGDGTIHLLPGGGEPDDGSVREAMRL